MTRDATFDLLIRCTCLLALALLIRCAPVWTGCLPELPAILSPAPEPVPEASASQSAAPPPAADTGQAPERQLPQLRFRDLPEEPAPEPPATDPATAPEPLPAFTAGDADALTIRGNCTLPYDRAALLLEPLPQISLTDGPLVLIVQTHSTEAFTPEPGWEYEETEACRTLDPHHSVIRLGAEIAAVLEERGIPVLHDTTINDYPSYSGSYDRMEAIILRYLEAYPSIRMVLDVHRDAFEEADGSMGGTARDGSARVMLVTGTNEGGLHHPGWQNNLSFSMKLEALLGKNCPGLSRGISLTTQRYNQHLTEFSLLAEFGAAGDTLQEAIAAARSFAESLSQLLAGISADKTQNFP